MKFICLRLLIISNNKILFQLKCYGAEDDKILGIPGEVKYCVFFLGLVLCYCE